MPRRPDLHTAPPPTPFRPGERGAGEGTQGSGARALRGRQGGQGSG
eukprot:CAMPEP_0175083198 /NCGR_PEP_ID=MMETSP0052_2-20121109/27214_1 /TAXON_ID=51329 ORGANISM="Polytomella parva, Strain SAG 63-3" /NCGR_SAMPLE_ID=MMETSP0052_2 /ASSEMBLY_ACC=CAM_ASM_000194 /LENGTH=45 /DNA_ID= /DNA_START= /DNA_END= /DNA_ORIENTATION=